MKNSTILICIILGCIITVLVGRIITVLVGRSATSETDYPSIEINDENIIGTDETLIGTKALKRIPGHDELFYDVTTNIVYFWGGHLNGTRYDATPSSYYASNGLPYKYNPETNTLETISFE